MVEYKQNFHARKLSGIHRKPLNVGLVAKICRVSKKTVLKWIYKDALKAFTTFGGHYRIWPGDLKDFIVKSGLDVPFQFVDERKTTFLIVDDEDSRIIGGCGIKTAPRYGRVEVGYGVASTARGRGAATEALRLPPGTALKSSQKISSRENTRRPSPET